MLTIQNYVRAKSLDEAYQLNQKRSNRIIGGMLWMKMKNGRIGTAIDLCDLGLNTIVETDEQFTIGAMVSLRQVEHHEGLQNYTDHAFARAVQDIVGVQFRNMATIGGSVWGRFGFSDVLTMLLSMDSYVESYKGGILPLDEFVSLKKDNDILVNIIIKKTPGAFVYQAMRNQRTDFPVLTCAVSRLGDGHRTVIGARPGKAVVFNDEQGILTKGITEASAQTWAAYVAKQVETDSNLRASAAYRTHLAKVLTCRSMMELGGGNS